MNFSQKRSCSRYSDQYIPPYERLLRRNLKWRPKRVQEETKLKKLCEEGRLILFTQPEGYDYCFINEQTSIQVIDDLIDQAKLTNHFSMDTQDDPLRHRPATLQIEFIRHQLPPIVIIIEVHYLPQSTTPLFRKIQHLCSIIFTSNNHIYSWESALQKLGKFNSFNLVNSDINIQDHNIQDKFSTGELCSLQTAIKFEYEEYLDKTATVAEWACGIDFSLGTYITEHVAGAERTYRINEEKKYRTISTQYAINDVFAVTKLIYRTSLANLLTPPATVESEPTPDYETINDTQEQSLELQPLNEPLIDEELIVHAPDELSLNETEIDCNENEIDYNECSTINNNVEQDRRISIINEIKTSNNNLELENVSDDEQRKNGRDYNESRTVHVQDQPMELEIYNDDSCYQRLSKVKKIYLYDKSIEIISDDELDNQSLPEMMKIHLQHKPSHLFTTQNYNDNNLNEMMTVHASDEPCQVRNSVNLCPNKSTTKTLTSKQIRNRNANRRHRANRYRYEVVRHIYPSFNIIKVMQVLDAMNIVPVNINMINSVLFIGLKNKTMVNEVNQMLNDRIFTKQHYERLYRRESRR